MISNSKWERRERGGETEKDWETEKINLAKIYLLFPFQYCLSQISFATGISFR